MSDKSIREHVVYLLRGGGAHLDFEKAIAEIPPELHGRRVEGFDHSLWQLLEHLRICQWDILEFTRDPDHVSPEFPVGLWPDQPAPPTGLHWERSVQQFRDDLEAMIDLVEDEDRSLLVKIPHGDGQTLLREALLVADHNAYHLGQIVVLRRLLGIWNG